MGEKGTSKFEPSWSCLRVTKPIHGLWHSQWQSFFDCELPYLEKSRYLTNLRFFTIYNLNYMFRYVILSCLCKVLAKILVKVFTLS